jgi:hypothetical protein
MPTNLMLRRSRTTVGVHGNGVRKSTLHESALGVEFVRGSVTNEASVVTGQGSPVPTSSRHAHTFACANLESE